MFAPLDQMPSSIRAHLRYPQDLLMVLSSMYGRYHVQNPRRFAEATEQWIPSPAASNGSLGSEPTPANGSIKPFEPVYELSQLPGSGTASFNVWEPMSPDMPSSPGQYGGQDLAALFVASSDYSDYGSLTAYRTPGTVDDAFPAPALADRSMALRLSQQKLGQTIHGDGLGIGVGSMSMLLLATPNASNVVYIRPVYVTSPDGSGDKLLGVLAASPTSSQATYASSLPVAIANLLEPSPAQVSPRGGGAVPPQVKRLLYLAAREFAAAKRALKQQDLGLYESDNKAGIAYVDQAYALLAKSAPAKGKHATRPSGSTKPAPPATASRVARTGRAGTTAGVTGEGTGSA
jgi:uncharacterized membrane protein (UPF0182 family)